MKSNGETVASRGKGVGRGFVHFAVAARSQQNRLALEGMQFSCGNLVSDQTTALTFMDYERH